MWNAYKISWRLQSPMHIGLKKTGNLQVTRPYVPSWVVWGAFTARLTRDAGSSDYLDFGRRVSNEMAFMHLCFSRENVDTPTPWGDYRKDFDWQLLRSHTSTALQDGYTKEEGSLHETEFIAPRDRDGGPVCLCGTVFVKEGSNLEWRKAAKRLSIGGERSYGWGRVELQKTEMLTESGWILASERPSRTFTGSGEPIPGHVLRRNGRKEELFLNGPTEVVVRRTTNPEVGQFGLHVTKPRFCWAPDSFSPEGVTLVIDPEGYLAAE